MMKVTRNRAFDAKTFIIYQETIKNFKPLTNEKEKELGASILQGDRNARNQLIEGYLPLVIRCANNIRTAKVPMEELVAAGNYGLAIAASRFDPNMGRRFYFYGAPGFFRG